MAIDCDVDLLALHAAHPRRYPFLLDSAARGTRQGRHDILLGLPGESFWCNPDGQLAGDAARGRDFLGELDRHWLRERCTRHDKPVPFVSGWFVFLAYELAGQIEPVLDLPADPGWPIAFATRIRAAIVRDHLSGQTYVCADDRQSAERVCRDAAALDHRFDGSLPQLGPIRQEPPDAYVAAVEQARRHIRDGDIYQANLSREWHAELLAPAADAAMYGRLRQCNPGPFGALARWGDNAILSSSPERLLRLKDGRAETRPIAGTRPRGATASEDAALTQELIEHPKERAEHVMLIDLERNDLGRVCEPGSVVVDENMTLETYAHVHHIVSNVSGQLRAEVTPAEAIRAVFPGGTITGCPKVRCMQIIRQLETGPRGPYTGSLGYLDRDGDCDLNILIRTLVRTGRNLSLRAGAGIVADSVAELEVAETHSKALGLLHALDRAT